MEVCIGDLGLEYLPYEERQDGVTNPNSSALEKIRWRGDLISTYTYLKVFFKGVQFSTEMVLAAH